jgi:hypothetical protein
MILKPSHLRISDKEIEPVLLRVMIASAMNAVQHACRVQETPIRHYALKSTLTIVS